MENSGCFPQRKRTRLKNFDYGSSGMYFVTVCTKDKEKILWRSDNANSVGGGVLDAPLTGYHGQEKITVGINNNEKIPQSSDNQKIVGGGVLDAPLPELSDYGKIIDNQIITMNSIYKNINVEKYVIMPNHIHLLIFVDNTGGTSGTPSPTNAVIPAFVSTLKRFCNKQAGKDLFQRSFHDHIIRDDADYLKIWNYIDTNPAKWQEDCFYIE